MPEKVEKTKLQSTFEFEGVWEELLENKDFISVFLSEVLEDYILKQRWYGGKASKLNTLNFQSILGYNKEGKSTLGSSWKLILSKLFIIIIFSLLHL